MSIARPVAVSYQTAQFLIDQGQQFLRSFAIALLDALEDLRNVAHATHFSRFQQIGKTKNPYSVSGSVTAGAGSVLTFFANTDSKKMQY